MPELRDDTCLGARMGRDAEWDKLLPGECMRLAGIQRVCVAVLACALPAMAQGPRLSPHLPLVEQHSAADSAAAQAAHYVVLVSLDGFRWDYAERDGAKHLLALGKAGVWAPQGMVPSFPSLTFPNHYTIVTGLYPDHHGIVANNFYDPERHARYRIHDNAAVADGTWYGGVPLWSLAESQGMRTAILFWPGSEAEIAGQRPTWYAKFNAKTESTAEVQQARIDDAMALLKLPAEERPHFIAMYFSEPDHEGHKYGPDAPETRAAVLKMDAVVGRLRAALEKTALPIDLVVVSDHGMAKVEGGWVSLDAYADLANFETSGVLLYPRSEADAAKAYNELKHATSDFFVYRRKNVPANLHYSGNVREGDPVIVATGPFAIRAHKSGAAKDAAAAPMEGTEEPQPGAHGYDPQRMPEMKAIFFAAGPDIVPGKTVQPFENVNLYPWIAHLLGLKPAKNDGSLNILAGTLRDNGGDTPEPETAPAAATANPK
jgi:predicted AlkP superfamily pyrophosphatase or phosphodiesterase